MPYKTILVHMDSKVNPEPLLKAACSIVDDPHLHITGVFVKPPILTGLYAESGITAKMIELQEDETKRRENEARLLFEKTVDSYGLRSDWHSLDGYVDEAICQISKYADLVVIGQNGSLESPNSSHGVESNIVMSSARPVLIVPYIGFTRKPGSKILVAWDESSEATRAVNDALPLLQSANHVEVLAVVDKSANDEVPTADICLYLARHRVKAEASKVVADGMKTSDIILNRATDRGADLLIMGAYGHSRIRELVLGGATHNMMQNMTLPVLMSH
ncbi:MAG: universal stress protein [Acidiferrobacterales bacterium]|nr:universal stress protein [Acidiferrobacterales bacterium]